MLSITNLQASVGDTPVLKGLNLQVKPGEIHAIMGPNGAGKSTLAKVLAGHPSYTIIDGTICFQGNDIGESSPEERSLAGLFMSFQYPVEIPGVTNRQFLLSAFNAKQQALGKDELSKEAFETLVQEKSKLIGLRTEFLDRNVNEGFSGGEKKRNEILQMALLDPSLAILDETDSGLDIDALKVVADGINHLMSKEKGLILITHYERLLEYVKPHYIHVMVDGKIVRSGGFELAKELEESGYEALLMEAGV